MVGALAGLTVALAAIPFATGSLLTAGMVIVIYGFAGFAITSPQSHRLITLAPQSTSVLVSLNAAILYLAISLSGVFGALGMGIVGAAHLGFIAAGIALFALAVSELSHRLTQRRLALSATIRTADHTDN